MNKPLVFGVFQHLGPGTQVSGTWRNEEDQSHRFLEIDYWTELARLLEAAAFDFIFLADSHGYPVRDGEVIDSALRDPSHTLAGDPTVIVAAMAAVTDRLGFVVTSSTTTELPQIHARRFATLDHLTCGRIGWNIVTEGSEATAKLIGSELVAHDRRYDSADDYLDVALRLWEGCWDDDALRFDREAGVYAEPDHVRRVQHDGPFYRADGILTLPPSPQRTPVLFQAGSSKRGKEFAARNAEGVFLGGGDPGKVAQNVRDLRENAAALGRDPALLKIIVGVVFIVAPTLEEARLKRARMTEHATRESAAAAYFNHTGIDLFALDQSAPLGDVRTELIQSGIERYAGDGISAPTVAEILEDRRVNGVNGTIFVGTPEGVVDQAEEFVAQTEIDGFMLQTFVTPGTYRDFIDLVLPVLVSRGLAKTDYSGATLRENLFGAGPQLPGEHRGGSFRI